MLVWLLDYDKFVKVNNIQPVTNPNMFSSGNVPTPDGLFSTEIFGTSSSERKETFGYIDLHDYYLHPKVYLSLKRLNRKFESVIYGTKKFVIKNGVLEEDDANGGTGIKWLYDNWEKIKFTKNDSGQRNERVDLLSNNPKDIVFTNKFAVLPAFYRDVNIQSTDTNPKVPEINKLYSNIIRNVRTVKESTTMEMIIQSLRGKTQDLLVDIYNLLKDKIQGKSGYIRQALMGKSVDYSSRLVITAAPYTSNSYKDQLVDFTHTAISLSHICANYTPFIIFWLKNWFKVNIEDQAHAFPYIDDKGEKHFIKLDSPKTHFNEEYIEKHMQNFVKNPYTRFDTIELPVSQKDKEKYDIKKNPLYRFEGMRLSHGDSTVQKDQYKPNVRRPITWTDLLYMAAIDVTEDKFVWVTRYPVTDYQGSYTTMISVLSTRDTMPMMVNGRLYKNYPVINPYVKKSDMDVIFRDTMTICPLLLGSLGADHDGDQVTEKVVYSQECLDECQKIMMSKANLLSVKGTGIRSIGNEGVQTLYSMTKFH